MGNLRHRIKWLRRREKHLQTRAFGPRYKFTHEDAHFIGHIGHFDAYIVDYGDNDRELWLIASNNIEMVPEDLVTSHTGQYPLHRAILVLEKLQKQETALDIRN